MKKIVLNPLLTFSLFATPSLFAMEERSLLSTKNSIELTPIYKRPEERSQKESIDSLVFNVCSQFDRKDDWLTSVTSFFKPLSDDEVKEYLNKIKTIIPLSMPKEEKEKFIEKLAEKSSAFRQLMNHLIFRKLDAFRNVNGSTIDTVQDSIPAQFFPILIKKFVIDEARKRFFATRTTKYEYTFEGHTEPIKAIDCCSTILQCATGSLDKTIRLWNLETGNCDHVIRHKNKIKDLSYKSNGTQLASATKNKIYIWNPRTGEFLFSFKFFEGPIGAISFSREGNNNNLLLVHSTNNKSYLYNRNKKRLEFIGSFDQVYKDISSFNIYRGDDYTVSFNKGFKSVHYKKKSDILTLCKQALKNSKDNPKLLKLLKRSATISRLTELDKKLIGLETDKEAKTPQNPLQLKI